MTYRILYRLFLLRMVDVEMLSADAKGDSNKLLGQLAALLVSVSVFPLAPMGFGMAFATPAAQSVGVHLMVATTMLVVGLFAVLSWDTALPDVRDVMVLGPLPVRTATIFLAKLSAVSSAMGLTIAAFHSAAGLVWPPNILRGNSFTGLLRSYAVWWFVMAAAGAFTYCSLLAMQGMAALLLPRRYFLRISSVLQIAAFGFLVIGYFADFNPGVDRAASPSYWFAALFEQLEGWGASPLLAGRAWMAMILVCGGALPVYALAYFRTLRRIVEEPDIASSGSRWMQSGRMGGGLRFGNAFTTAIVQFSIRSLMRSRQHRLLLSFYLGVGFAAGVFFNKGGRAEGLQCFTLVMIALCIAGMRVVFALPLHLRANWIFRVLPLPAGSDSLVARRRALWLLGFLPALSGSALAVLCMWPLMDALKHLALLALTGTILVEICLRGTQKVPFTCSWLPGKSNVNIVVMASLLVALPGILKLAELERYAFRDAVIFTWTLAALSAVCICARWWSQSNSAELRFDELDDPVVFELGLK